MTGLQHGLARGCTRCPFCHSVFHDDGVADHVQHCAHRLARERVEDAGAPAGEDEARLDRLETSLGALGWYSTYRALRRLRRPLSRELAAVRAFMRGNDQPVLGSPGTPSRETIALAVKLIEEECGKELVRDALQRADAAAALRRDDRQAVVDVADGIVDGIYVLLWTAHAFGLGDRLHRVWELVAEKNASKVGAPKDPVTGKVLRPEGWEPPDVWGAVYGED